MKPGSATQPPAGVGKVGTEIMQSAAQREPRTGCATGWYFTIPALLAISLPVVPAPQPTVRPTARHAATRPATYRNPIVRNVADPFVLKHRGEYDLYRTTVGNGLDVMTSRGLVQWRPGPAVWRPASREAASAGWQPAVTPGEAWEGIWVEGRRC